MKIACAVCEIRPVRELLTVFDSLRGEAFPWLLESTLYDGRCGRFSFAGADPYLVLRARGRACELECRRAVREDLLLGHSRRDGDPFEVLRELLLPTLEGDVAVALPFVGGAVGYCAYEAAVHCDRIALCARDDLALPEFYWLFVDRLLVFDHAEQRLFASGLGFGRTRFEAEVRAAAAVRALEAKVYAMPEADPASLRALGETLPLASERLRPELRACEPQIALDARAFSASLDSGDYGKAVEQIQEWIVDGDVYQVNLTRRLETRSTAAPWNVYRVLRRINPAPFAAFLDFPEVAVVGSSPERFLRLTADKAVESRPIKGTRPRSVDPAQDAETARELADSEKDQAENLMIVDLVRNDLGRVCAIGSVHVPELMRIEGYATVYQMVSAVRGQLRLDLDALDLVRAAFPPGSMTGAPKLAAVACIDRLEPVARGIYSGALGYFDQRGGLDLCVVIRTLLCLPDGRVVFHVGGGIVADSEVRAEFAECADKARALIAALAKASAGNLA